MYAFNSRMLASASLVVIAAAGLASPAFAQTPAPVESTPSKEAAEDTPPEGEASNAEGQPVSEGEIVVTGSRIRRNTYSTPSPVDVITREDAVLAGATSTSEALQSGTVTSGSAQINDTFVGFLSEGGQGANTVGLRGLGAKRTLVLLNGRRLAPAGSTAEVVVADLNVLPSAILQRIEILREGASSVYGSDAISGVVNIITDSKLDGLTIDAFTNQPVEHGGGGRTYRVSLVGGKTFGALNVIGSLEYRNRTELKLGDREEFRCPRDLYIDPATGVGQGQLTPDLSRERCFPYQFETIGIAQSYIIALGAGTNRFTYPTGNIGVVQNVNVFNSRPETPASLLYLDTLSSPIETYSAFLSTTLETGILGDAVFYTEGLYNRRLTEQTSATQLAVDNNERYGFFRNRTGRVTSPFFPTVFANAGYTSLRPLIAPFGYRSEGKQQVDFFRGVAGLRGQVGIGDLRYDLSGMFSKNVGNYSSTAATLDRWINATNPVLAPAGTPAAVITVAQPGTLGAGNSYTCAINVTAGVYNGGNCIAADLLNPQALAGNVDQRLLDYLYSTHESRNQFTQLDGMGVVDGSLFNLPGGALKFAAGVEIRHDKLKDVPSEAQQSGTIVGFSSGGITQGKDTVTEVFGELNAPILTERPGFYDLSVAASARYVNYKSYGSDTVYRLNGQWAPIRNIRFRGSYGTSFRAPNLYELNVASQVGFRGAGDDPCDEFATRQTPGSVRYNNCLTQLTQVLGSQAAALAYKATSGFSVVTSGGQGVLEAEKSKSWGLGAVLQAPRQIGDLSLAVDYFNVRVKGSITTIGGTNILSLCYDADDYPNNIYCGLVDPRETAQGNLVNVRDAYINVAQEKVTGFDISGRYARNVGPGRLTLNVRATRILKSIYQTFASDDPFNYAGLVGYQGTVGGPKWVANGDARFETGPWAFRWGVDYVGPMDSNEAFEIDPDVDPFDLRSDTYWKHTASLQYSWKDVAQFTVGMNNVFNKLPDTISSCPIGSCQFPRIGNYFNYSGYDFLGRSVFLNVTRTF